MPYYAWRGVTIRGDICKGKLFARSVTHLEKNLFERDIALLQHRLLAVRSVRRVSLGMQISFFQALRHLLISGMRLPEALHLVSEQQGKSTPFQASLYTIAHDVELGTLMHEAFAKQTSWLDGITQAMLHIGQETGSLKRSLELIIMRLQRLESFGKKMRSALIVPAITFVFFLASLILIFTVIIPSFSSFFLSRGDQIPMITRVLLAISHAMVNGHILVVGIGIAISGIVMHAACRTDRGQRSKDWLLLRIPFVSKYIRMHSCAHFFQTLALIMQQGGHIATALPLARKSITNRYIQEELLLIEQDVVSGTMLAKAMRSYAWFTPESCSLALLGEETGSLALMLDQASQIYNDMIERQLSMIATLLQPMLLVILGLLVGLLIFAIYIPLFQLPDSYTFL